MTSEEADDRDLAQRAIDCAEAETAPKVLITDARVDAFVDFMRTHIEHGKTEFRRAYLRATNRQVQILTSKIIIVGDTPDVERAVLQFRNCDVLAPSFAPGWRRERDSNPR